MNQSAANDLFKVIFHHHNPGSSLSHPKSTQKHEFLAIHQKLQHSEALKHSFAIYGTKAYLRELSVCRKGIDGK